MDMTMIEKFIGSPFAKRAVADMEAADAVDAASRHASAAAEFVRVEQARVDDLARLAPLESKALAELRKHEAAATAAREALDVVRRKIFETKHQAAFRLAQLDRELVASANPLIDEAIARGNNRVAAIQRDGARIEDRRSSVIGGKAYLTFSNYAGIGRIVSSWTAARRQLEALKHRHIDDVVATIVEIEKTIRWSAVNEFEGPSDNPAA